ncbi:MAG: hypothetical protein ACFFCO_11390 [Promethearchaeota archaeon]
MRLTVLFDAVRCRTAGDFLIRDLAGTSGRLDVLCRVLVATFRTVPRFCPHTSFHAVLGGPPVPPLLLKVKDASPGTIPESELACALLLKGLLIRAQTQIPAHTEAWPQFTITRQGFAESLKEVVGKEGQLFYLIEGGEPLAKVSIDLAAPLVFVLGDHQGVPSEHEALLMQQNVQKVCIGERSLLGSQVITLLLLELARRLEMDSLNSEAKSKRSGE